MKDDTHHGLTFDEWDEARFPRAKTQDFDRVVERAISRRGFLGGVLAFGSGAAVMGSGRLKGSTALAQAAGRFPFDQIAAQTDGTVHVPEGYDWQVLVRWGDPLFSDAPSSTHETGVPTEGSDRVFGENTDGMELFSSTAARSSPSTTNTPTTTSTCRLEHCRGDSLTRSARRARPTTCCGCRTSRASPSWRVAEGRERLVASSSTAPSTAASRTTRRCDRRTRRRARADEDRGRSDRHEVPRHVQQLRLGPDAVGHLPDLRGKLQRLLRRDRRDADRRDDRRRLRPLRHRGGGLGLRLPPLRSALRRLARTRTSRTAPAGSSRSTRATRRDARQAHRARPLQARERRLCAAPKTTGVVVYMGDDERGEFMYKWVSRDAYDEGGDTSTLLDEGSSSPRTSRTTRPAQWVALTPDATGMEPAEIAIFTRTAASAVGATTMDRPEWIAVNPTAPEAYCCLTNNSRRGATDEAGEVLTNAGGDPMEVNAPEPARDQRVRPDRPLAPCGRRPRQRRASTGISTSWPATRTSTRTAPMPEPTTSTRATSSTRPTGCRSTPPA